MEEEEAAVEGEGGGGYEEVFGDDLMRFEFDRVLGGV